MPRHNGGKMGFQRVRASALAFGLATALSLVTVLPGLAANSTVVVSQSNMNGWTSFQEGGNGTFALVNGPAPAPAGIGSARMTLDSADDGMVVATAAHVGTFLNQINKLQYSTYVASGGPPQAIALQFEIDFDSTDANSAFQGRLVYEPYHTQTVLSGQWQQWNTLDNSSSGNWWFTRAPGNTVCTMGNPCTWSEVLTYYPRISVLGRTILKAGSGWSSFNGNVDKLVIGVGADETTYDFEPYEAADDKDDCKGGGWQNVRRADGSSFKNQGDCVSYTNNGR
jgi:hypothetical protein